MPGHVFIARGDLRRLACDAWLMPCDIEARPENKWLLPDKQAPTWPQRPAGWADDGLRVLKVQDWPSSGPQPWLVNVGGFEGTPIRWYMDGVRQFLEKVCPAVSSRQRWLARAKPLIALNIVGTGQGGKKRDAGEVVTALLPVLYETVERDDVDVALVAYDGPGHAAAQAARHRLGDRRAWQGLNHRAGLRSCVLGRGAAVVFECLTVSLT